jgi:hypothetical protein
MRSTLCICSTLLFTGIGIGRAAAQVCSGEFGFAGSPAHAFVGIGLNSSAQTYHGGLRVGGKHVFGEAELGMATYQVGGDAWDYGLGFGLELGPPEQAKGQFCPEVFVGTSRGPNDVGGTGINYSETHFAIGAAVGFVLAHKKGIDVVPTASFFMANAWYKLTAPATRDSTGFDTWEIVSLGLGLGFNDQVVLGPSIAFPISLTGAGTAYGVSFSIKLKNPR